jgi:glycosyltransferase involved in cell wall biosynthesis
MVGGQETGNETYVLGLIGGFAEIDGRFQLVVYHTRSVARGGSPNVIYRRLAGESPWTRLTLDLPVRSWRDRIDVMHTTYTAPVWGWCPVVLTVHDISFRSHPEWFSKRDLRVLSTVVPWSMRRAARVVTVSDQCRREILDHYGLPEEKVVRVYNAAGPAAQPIDPAEAQAEVAALGIDSSRLNVLAVGNLQPRKNLIRLIKAFEIVRSAGIDADLILVGPEHYRSSLVREAAAGLGGRVRLTGYLNHRQLAACYATATVFAFPSLYEGFGIPAIEAMAHGTPVVCAKAGALPEVCADAALYFDPLDVESIANALRRLLTDPDLRAELSRAGKVRNQRFSWRRAAEETLAVYRDVVRTSASPHTES